MTGMATTGAILSLLAATLLELAALPFHVVVFFARRGRIRREIRALLEARR